MDLSQIDGLDARLEKSRELKETLTKRVKDFIETKVKSRGKEVELICEL